MSAWPDTDDPHELFDRLVEAKDSDGLPVLPPDDDKVAATLAETPRARDDVLAEIPADFVEFTVERLAEVAVMAGCRPEYFPVVVAAFEAIAEWTNLRALTSTTGGFWMAAIVNGPVVDDLAINNGTGLFGPGFRANATIGRAISLTFLPVGGVYPGDGTHASHGFAGRYTNCFAEKGRSKHGCPFTPTSRGWTPTRTP